MYNRRRFNTYIDYFREQFGERVQKIAINAGFTCPNRYGKIGVSGCLYCNNEAFNPSYCDSNKTITTQLTEGIEFMSVRYKRASKYLAYFQPYSNTYAPIEVLKQRYEEALRFPGIIGLVIGTRADCIDEEKLNYLKQLSQSHYVMIEFGIESCNNLTLKKLNRGLTYEQTASAIHQCHEYGIKTGGHIILGLPGESRQEMLNHAAIISNLPLQTLKIHQLQIMRNTPLEQDYLQNPNQYQLFELKEYIDFVIQFTERLSPAFVIERFASEVPPRYLVAPNWGLIRNDQLTIMIEKRMKELDTWQGKMFVA